jgi:hypothetical protein
MIPTPVLHRCSLLGTGPESISLRLYIHYNPIGPVAATVPNIRFEARAKDSAAPF